VPPDPDADPDTVRPRAPDLAAFAHVKDAALRGLLAHYLDLRQENRAPFRRQISPMDFPGLLGNVFLYECTGNGADYYIRLAGNEVARMLQTAKAGAKMSEVFPADVFPVMLERYRRICGTLSVMYNGGRVFHRLGGTGTGERIVMPLLDDAGAPRFLFGATVYHLTQAEVHLPPGQEPQSIIYTPL
jgi:hypothetical protein